HPAILEVMRRIPHGQPAVAFVAQSLELGHPGRLIAEKSAAVDGHGELETVVETRDEAGEVAAPRDSGEPDAIGVDLGHCAEHGVRHDHVSYCVVWPLVLHRVVYLVESTPPRRAAGRVALPLPVRSFRHAAARVHGDCGVSPGDPESDPGGE